MTRELTVLGLETSCDETAAAIVRGSAGGPGRILSNIVFSQLAEHEAYGGVVPEIAARAHIERLDGLVAAALAEAGLELSDLDGIGATAGPGLIGGVIVGLLTAKGLALGAGKPLIAVNHLEGHALTARLVEACPFPYLLLLVSGGHCQLVSVEALGRYRVLATTIDDAVGEAFDKTAKLLGLGFPGGPAVERAALTGNAKRFPFPRPLIDREELAFSFAGLKTAVRYTAGRMASLSERDVADICAGFQAAVSDVLVHRTRQAMRLFKAAHDSNRFVVAGGVASNRALRTALEAAARTEGFRLIAPPPALCTDNGAMIAWAALERLEAGRISPLDSVARPRWPLAELG